MSKVLYKYYSSDYLVDTQKLSTLQNMQFWFGGNKIQNDPYDLIGANDFLHKSYVGRNLMKYITSKSGKVDLFKNQVNQFASCSFSRVSTERLMWAHYADSYKGFCVAYQFDLPELLHNVIYLDKFPVSGLSYNHNGQIYSIEQILDEWLSNNNINTIAELITSFATIKSQEWVYEQEERLIEKIKKESGDNFNWSKYHASPKYIIFGSRFDYKRNGKQMSQILSKWKMSKSELFSIKTEALEHFDISVENLDTSTISKYFNLLK